MRWDNRDDVYTQRLDKKLFTINPGPLIIYVFNMPSVNSMWDSLFTKIPRELRLFHVIKYECPSDF